MIICSHIPIHPLELHRFKLNVHGHMHQNVLDDPRYLNVCMERTNFTPVDFEYILEYLQRQNESQG